MIDPKVGEAFEATGFVFTCVGHTPDGTPIPGHPCWPAGKAPKIKVVKPDGTKEIKQFPAPPTAEKPAKAPRTPAAQQVGPPATQKPVGSVVTQTALPGPAKNYKAPRRWNRYARKTPPKIVIHEEPWNAWQWLALLAALALAVLLVWGLVEHDKQTALNQLTSGAAAIRGGR